jgi:hypothetical protein
MEKAHRAIAARKPRFLILALVSFLMEVTPGLGGMGMGLLLRSSTLPTPTARIRWLDGKAFLQEITR